ncbi:MAG: hypothetical protein A3C07_04635 [Candidatus Sungbacteria bacterium RIFCSPHIGHO2_02_FULL_47_11]|uniref:Rieske domain-containing protein n=1 Tax=Candidatus Sungbacteria bacterium RIFCSPHIGHO2_02_FULL_47_11 TaxID=1802270 RepID=A0A1G2KJQ2_9BACT|nr:MAG: hypothetical protein A3C07_04635 [Candidatus Sungbacteria bacterium RIFCSPHIGHO2_02_FULL_47_11]
MVIEKQGQVKTGVLAKAKLSRRDFLGWIIQFGLFTTLAGMIAPALTYLWPVTRRGPAGGLSDVCAEDDILVWGGKKIILAGSAILVIRTPQGFKAYSAICTHLGCLVEWDGKKREIICPCHAGLFDLDGKVVAGPPPRPLPSYEVSVVNGRVMVKV